MRRLKVSLALGILPAATRQVEFKPALQQTVALFEQWGATAEELDALRHGENDDDLAFRLVAAGVDTKFDASIAFRENRESLLKTLQSFRKILVAWCGKHRCALPSFWQRGDEELLGEVSAELEITGFLLEWDRGYPISLCRKLPRDGGLEEFWQAAEVSSDISALETALSLTPEDLEAAQSKLDNLKEAGATATADDPSLRGRI